MINDGRWFGQLFCQLHQYSLVDPIQPNRVVYVQVMQQIANHLNFYYGGFIVFPISIFQLKGMDSQLEYITSYETLQRTTHCDSVICLSTCFGVFV